MFCTTCGRQLEGNELFCPGCGAKVEAVSEPTPHPAEPGVAASGMPEALEDLTPPAGNETPAPDPAAAEQAAQTPDAAHESTPVPEAWQSPDPYREGGFGEEAVPVPQKKRSLGKAIALALAAVVALGAIAFCAWKLLSGRNRETRLETAARASVDQLKEDLHSLPNLGQILDIADDLDQSGLVNWKMDLSVKAADVDASITMEMKTDRSAQASGLDLSVTVNKLFTAPVDLQLYQDKDWIQLGSRALLGDDVIGLSLEDFARRWNDSKLGELADLKLPDDFSVSAPQVMTDLKQILADTFGEDWTRFYETVEVVPYEGTPHFTDGTTYTLSWDAELFKPIYEKSEAYMKNMQANILDTLANPEKEYAYLTVQLLGQTQGQFRIQDDQLTGIYLYTDEGYGFELRMEGEDSPWKRIEVSVTEGGSTHSMVFETEIADGRLTIAVKDAESAEKQAWIVYEDETGSLNVYTEENKSIFDQIPGGSVKLNLRPENGQITCSGSLDVEELGETLGMSFQMTVGSQQEKLQPLSAEAKDLLNLSEQKLQGLVMKIGMKLQSILTQDALGSIFNY